MDPLESGSLDFLHSSSCATLLEFRKQLDCDDYVVSIRMLDLPRRPEGITHRQAAWRRAVWAAGSCGIEAAARWVGPLVGVRLATEEHLCRDGLSKRLRETLSLLLKGWSEKQAAGELEHQNRA